MRLRQRLKRHYSLVEACIEKRTRESSGVRANVHHNVPSYRCPNVHQGLIIVRKWLKRTNVKAGTSNQPSYSLLQAAQTSPPVLDLYCPMLVSNSAHSHVGSCRIRLLLAVSPPRFKVVFRLLDAGQEYKNGSQDKISSPKPVRLCRQTMQPLKASPLHPYGRSS